MRHKLPLPTRISILYLIIGVLTFVSVVPMYFYASRVVAINREALKVNEQYLQNTITSSLAEDIAQRDINLQTVLGNLSSAILVTTGGDLNTDRMSAPELRALLETFVESSSRDLAYATILNAEGKGPSVGRIPPDPFLQKELVRAFEAAREGRAYSGQALAVDRQTLMLVSTPIMVCPIDGSELVRIGGTEVCTRVSGVPQAGGRFIGMIGALVDLRYLVNRLQDVSTGGLLAYVVDGEGRLVASSSPKYVTGQDMKNIAIVRRFVEQGGRAMVRETTEFSITDKGRTTDMLGSYRRVPSLEWAVVAQKAQDEAYAGVYEMQSSALWREIAALLVAVFVGVLAARAIIGPLRVLTESSRAIARGDFSQRVHLKSRTEIGELAQTFNVMSEDLERYVLDLKRAAEENRALFLGSIQMLAGAVDEKDPYTRGHSDRVTRYSVLLASELGLPKEEIETVRIAAQLHDVGKIGIEDRILKKPGALTPEEFEIMKTHTVKGASILRPVQQLTAMIPGIELHHESMDGRGYPYGHKGEAIPISARIIMVADTFDAMTTNRPYQAAMDPEYVVRIINSLVGTKFDPKVVAALTAVFGRGDLVGVAKSTPKSEAAVSAAATASA